MNSLSDLLTRLSFELHPRLAGQPKATCISIFAARLLKEKDVFFQKSTTLTIRGITVTPDLYITLPEEAFVHLRCEVLSENFDDDILSYDQYRVYKKLAGIPCYLIKFDSECPRIRLEKNDDSFRHIFEAGKLAQLRGGMKITKLAGPELREVNLQKILPLFDKEFTSKLSENHKFTESEKSNNGLKVVEIVSPSKMTVYLTVENRDKIDGLEGRQLLVKFGRREGPNYRFILDSVVSKCLKLSAAATMRELGSSTIWDKEVYFEKFCEQLSNIKLAQKNGDKRLGLLFQKRENYIYIYSPSVAIVIIKRKDEGSHLMNVYNYLVHEYKNVRGIPGLEIVFGTNHVGNYNLNYF